MPAKRRDVVSELAGGGDDPAPVERLDVIRQWPREIFRHMGNGHPWIIFNEEQQAAEWQAELLRLIRSFNEQAGEFPQIDQQIRNVSGVSVVLGEQKYSTWTRAAYGSMRLFLLGLTHLYEMANKAAFTNSKLSEALACVLPDWRQDGSPDCLPLRFSVLDVFPIQIPESVSSVANQSAYLSTAGLMLTQLGITIESIQQIEAMIEIERKSVPSERYTKARRQTEWAKILEISDRSIRSWDDRKSGKRRVEGRGEQYRLDFILSRFPNYEDD